MPLKNYLEKICYSIGAKKLAFLYFHSAFWFPGMVNWAHKILLKKVQESPENSEKKFASAMAEVSSQGVYGMLNQSHVIVNLLSWKTNMPESHCCFSFLLIK